MPQVGAEQRAHVRRVALDEERAVELLVADLDLAHAHPLLERRLDPLDLQREMGEKAADLDARAGHAIPIAEDHEQVARPALDPAQSR